MPQKIQQFNPNEFPTFNPEEFATTAVSNKMPSAPPRATLQRDPYEEVGEWISPYIPEPVKKAGRWAMSPLTDIASRYLAPLGQRMQQSDINDKSEPAFYMPKIMTGGAKLGPKQWTGAYLESLGHAVDESTSPFNAGMMLASAGSSAALRAGARAVPEGVDAALLAARRAGNLDEAARITAELQSARKTIGQTEAIRKTLQGANLAANTGLVGEGVVNFTRTGDPTSLIPAAFGGMGFVSEGRALGRQVPGAAPESFELPVPKREPVRDAQGREIAPPQTELPERPAGPWDSNKAPSPRRGVDQQFDNWVDRLLHDETGTLDLDALRGNKQVAINESEAGRNVEKEARISANLSERPPVEEPPTRRMGEIGYRQTGRRVADPSVLGDLQQSLERLANYPNQLDSYIERFRDYNSEAVRNAVNYAMDLREFGLPEGSTTEPIPAQTYWQREYPNSPAAVGSSEPNLTRDVRDLGLDNLTDEQVRNAIPYYRDRGRNDIVDYLERNYRGTESRTPTPRSSRRGRTAYDNTADHVIGIESTDSVEGIDERLRELFNNDMIGPDDVPELVRAFGRHPNVSGRNFAISELRRLDSMRQDSMARRSTSITPEGGSGYFSDMINQIAEMSPDEAVTYVRSMRDSIYPEDVALLERTVSTHNRGQHPSVDAAINEVRRLDSEGYFGQHEVLTEPDEPNPYTDIRDRQRPTETLEAVEGRKKGSAFKRLSKLIGADNAEELVSGDKVLQYDERPYRTAGQKRLSKWETEHWNRWADGIINGVHKDPSKVGIEVVTNPDDSYYPNRLEVHYRNEAGEPLGTMHTDLNGEGISTLAVSSRAGLNRGKIMWSLVREAFKRGIMEPAGGTSDFTKNFIYRLKELIAKAQSERRMGGEKGSINIADFYYALNDLFDSVVQKFKGKKEEVAPKFDQDPSEARLKDLFEKQKAGNITPHELSEAQYLARIMRRELPSEPATEPVAAEPVAEPVATEPEPFDPSTLKFDEPQIPIQRNEIQFVDPQTGEIKSSAEAKPGDVLITPEPAAQPQRIQGKNRIILSEGPKQTTEQPMDPRLQAIFSPNNEPFGSNEPWSPVGEMPTEQLPIPEMPFRQDLEANAQPPRPWVPGWGVDFGPTARLPIPTSRLGPPERPFIKRRMGPELPPPGGILPPSGGGRMGPPPPPPFGPMHGPAPLRPRKLRPAPEQSLAKDIWNAPRSLQSIDLPGMTSAALRQSRPLAFTPAWIKAWGSAAKAFGSQAALDEINAKIKSSKYFKPEYMPIKDRTGRIIRYSEKPSIAEKLGVQMTNVINKREEAIVSSLAERIPGYGRYVKASNRAYTAFLNDLRAAKFEQMMDGAIAAGKDPELNKVLGESIAKFVNNATGRGNLRSLEPIAEELGLALYSPRALAARLEFMNPANYVKGDKAVKLEYWKSLARITASWGAFSALASLSPDVEVSLDPNNSDFGKIRIGNTRIDPGAGFQQLMVLLHRELPENWGGGGVTASTGKPGEPGKFTPFSSTPYASTRPGLAGKYLYNQLNPSLRFIVDMLYATSDKSKNGGFDLTDRSLQLILPMYLTDIADAAADDNVTAAVFAPLLSSMGQGVQTYDKGDFNAPKITPGIHRLTGIDLPTTQIGGRQR